MHDKDFLSAQRQTGLQQIPQEVVDEYERVANMLCRDGLPMPIGPMAMNGVLRRCGLEGPTALRPAQIDAVDWKSVPPKSRIIVRRDPANQQHGELVRFKLNGCLDVLLDGDVAVREYAQRHVSLDVQWTDDPFAGVSPGTSVAVLRGKREFDAKFIGVVDANSVRVAFKGGEQVVPKEAVKLVA